MKIIQDSLVNRFIKSYYRGDYQIAYLIYQEDRTLISRLPQTTLQTFLIDIFNKGMRKELADIVVYVGIIHPDLELKEQINFHLFLLQISAEERRYLEKFWKAMDGKK